MAFAEVALVIMYVLVSWSAFCILFSLLLKMSTILKMATFNFFPHIVLKSVLQSVNSKKKKAFLFHFLFLSTTEAKNMATSMLPLITLTFFNAMATSAVLLAKCVILSTSLLCLIYKPLRFTTRQCTMSEKQQTWVHVEHCIQVDSLVTVRSREKLISNLR